MNHWVGALTHGKAGRWLDGWVGNGGMERRKTGREWTGMWDDEWERRECLWIGSQTPALPEPLGLGVSQAGPRPAGLWEGTGWA